VGVQVGQDGRDQPLKGVPAEGAERDGQVQVVVAEVRASQGVPVVECGQKEGLLEEHMSGGDDGADAVWMPGGHQQRDRRSQ